METRIPSSVYRLQFNSQFTFRDAEKLVDYLKKLGISDCYISPIMKSVPGSQHNYDVTDHTKLNSEIGSEEDFGIFAEKLKTSGMGLILDLIPNHMCISVPHNPWWNDILENGPSSPYENFFNIDWDPIRPELKNKVLIPFLDQQFGRVIENKELQILYDQKAFFVQYFDSRYPTNPKSWNHILEAIAKEVENSLSDQAEDFYELLSIITALDHLPDMIEKSPAKIRERMREKEVIKNRFFSLIQRNKIVQNALDNILKRMNGTLDAPHTFDNLERFLQEQAYRLSHWRVAQDEINFRRFFDINELAGIRAENPKLFSILHSFPLNMVQKGWVTGFRIDHVDGLYHPNRYLRELQYASYQALVGEKPNVSPSESSPWFFIIIEKILAHKESLRNYWPVYGTTGYDFLNLLNGLFVDENSESKFLELYRTFTNLSYDPAKLLYDSKRFFLTISMSSELHVLARRLDRISQHHRYSYDFTLQSLFVALRSVMASLAVYRTYISADEKRIDEEDREQIIKAIENAKTINPALSTSIFDFIQDVLLLNEPSRLTDAQREERNHFVMRFQQLTGPVMAKGLEDTAFYRFYPLCSLNEVGGDLGSYSIQIDDFHKKNMERLRKWPHSFLATSTHDTKRSEDVRARINVLSEIPDEWSNAVHRFEQMNREKKIKMENGKFIPDRNEEYLIYQTLLGSWPLEPMDDKTFEEYIFRIDRYLQKAMREAKIHTSWINPNDEHDRGIHNFIYAILDRKQPNQFLDDLQQLIFRIKVPGIYNSLSQLLLKIASPGIPDFYQGSELWSFTLVDPDNRSPVDFSIRKQYLEEISKACNKDRIGCIKECMASPENGKIKLLITKEALNFRKTHAPLFSKGEYIPLKTEGEWNRHIIAFSRVFNNEGAVAIAGRFFSNLTSPGDLPLGLSVWRDTIIDGLIPGKYRDIFTDQQFVSDGTLSVAELFSYLPLALLSYES